MKLKELGPVWICNSEDRHGMGVNFLCPHCIGKEDVVYIGVWFTNPLDGGPPLDDPRPMWFRTGETFETLTLANPNGKGPNSLDFSKSGHWHGSIINGEIV